MEKVRRKVVKVPKPTKYRRSTPVGRLRRNVQKAARHARLAWERIASWRTDDPRLKAVGEGAKSVTTISDEMDHALQVLEQEGWEPPVKGPIAPAAGDRVAVIAKHRAKYAEALNDLLSSDPRALDELVVDRVLTSGELSLRRGKRLVLPAVPRSHVELVAEDEGKG